MSPIAALSKLDQAWMAYIDAEVAAVCRAKGWRRQIRRKWAAREKPLSRSRIDDYEWKLIPAEHVSSDRVDEEPEVSEHSLEFDEGTYFVLGLLSSKEVFVLQHSTSHCGVMGDHWFTRTYTEIDLAEARRAALMHSMVQGEVAARDEPPKLRGLPRSGLLERILLPLVEVFKPNSYSIT